MDHTYSTLRREYVGLLATTQFTRVQSAKAIALRIVREKPRYAVVSARTGVPIVWLLAIDDREGNCDPLTYFGNGERIIGTKKRTTLVPRGRGPFATWVDGTIDAVLYEHLDKIDEWDWSRACYQAELWNGFGPRMHGYPTGYLWSGTTHYRGGKYIHDGPTGWSPETIDKQMGVVPIMYQLGLLDPALVLPGWPIGV